MEKPTITKSKRFVPNKEIASRNNKYVPVDAAVLALAATHHFVRGTFFVALLADVHPASTVKRSLKKLFNLVLLVKMTPQQFYYSHIYHITDAGLATFRSKSPEATNLIRHKGATLPKQYFHSLMICDTTQNIALGVKKYGDGILYLSQILARIKDPVDRPMSFPYKVVFTFKGGKTVTFEGNANPDNAVNIIYTAHKVSRLILIEDERESPDFRSNFESGSLIRKIVGYEEICRDTSLDKRIVVTTLQQIGRTNCNVLFVYPTYAEAVRALEKATDELKHVFTASPRYLFGVQPTQDHPTMDPKPDTAIYDQPLLRIGMKSICLKDLWQE